MCKTATQYWEVFKAARFCFPWLRHILVDGGYADDQPKWTLRASGGWMIEILRTGATAKGFEVLPRPLDVDGPCAWLWPLPSVVFLQCLGSSRCVMNST